VSVETDPAAPGQSVLRTAYQQSVAAYWDAKRDPVNLRLGEVDGFYHHHCGVGEHDASALQVPAELRDQAIVAEMHRLENGQADLLLDHVGVIQPGDRLLDAGSGLATGIEDAFLTAYREGSFHYLLIVADYVGR
jgi:geranyl diphosphate 2-C-methyltransferase